VGSRKMNPCLPLREAGAIRRMTEEAKVVVTSGRGCATSGLPDGVEAIEERPEER